MWTLAVPAYAAEYAPFEAFYTTDAYGSYTEKTSFTGTELPYFYVRIPQLSSTAVPTVFSSWYGPEGLEMFSGVSYGEAVGTQEFWFAPNDWFAMKKHGDWSIVSNYAIDNPGAVCEFGVCEPANLYGFGLADGVSQYNFRVAPEPMSAALFLAGGGLLGLASRRRFKGRR